MTGPNYTKPRRKPPTLIIYPDELWGDNKTPKDAAKALQRKKIASMKDRPKYTTTEEDDLEEITTTAATPGYMTPFAFKGKKKKKIKEELEPKDVQQVRKIVKDIINNMFRDIWLKRNSWNKI